MQTLCSPTPGLWSRYSNFWLRASKFVGYSSNIQKFLAPEEFGPKNQKKHCTICITLFPHKLLSVEPEPNFQAPAIQNCLGSGSTALPETRRTTLNISICVSVKTRRCSPFALIETRRWSNLSLICSNCFTTPSAPASAHKILYIIYRFILMTITSCDLKTSRSSNCSKQCYDAVLHVSLVVCDWFPALQRLFEGLHSECVRRISYNYFNTFYDYTLAFDRNYASIYFENRKQQKHYEQVQMFSKLIGMAEKFNGRKSEPYALRETSTSLHITL